jgi:allophanate hydrolase
VRLLVIGSALRALGVDQSALGLTFLEEARTAPAYCLYSVNGTHAALVHDPVRGASIAGELVEVDDARFDEILRLEPPGITQEPIELDDGRIVSGAIGDPALMEREGVEITQHGSFAAFLASRADA